MNPGGESWLKEKFDAAGMKLDMGKSCIRFRKLENLPVDVVGEIARGQSVDEFIALYEAGRKK